MIDSVPKKVLGVLAGQDMPSTLLESWARTADLVLAADAGADHLQAFHFMPDWVIGDMDSAKGVHSQSQLHHDPSQDSTDCDKLLQKAIELGVHDITLASIEGDQLDHMIATLHSAIRHKISVRVALRTGIGWVLTGPESLETDSVIGRRVSLIPLELCTGVTLEGVEWPLTSAELSPSGATSISNCSLGDRIKVAIRSGSAFFYVEKVPSEMPIWP